jgi:hypothetical protein
LEEIYQKWNCTLCRLMCEMITYHMSGAEHIALMRKRDIRILKPG